MVRGTWAPVSWKGRLAPATPLAARIGQEIGVSAWTTIDQPMIDAFGKLTGDQHFIHVDPERAARETPHGGTIAHGFLTLSLLSQMAYQVCPMVEGTKSGVNYGFNRLRFVAPVRTGSRALMIATFVATLIVPSGPGSPAP